MKIIIHIISWLLLLLYGALTFYVAALGNMGFTFVALMALPALILLLLLYRGISSTYDIVCIVLAWLVLIVIGAYFYVELSTIDWK